MKVKDFIKFDYPIITESVQFYLSIRKGVYSRATVSRNRAGAREDLRPSGR